MDNQKLSHFLNMVNEWRNDYPTTKKGEIIFQNERLLTNVRFSDTAIHKIQKHMKGFENIPKAISQPHEAWSLWENPNKQLVTLRNYILFGKKNFIVQTRDGQITDAFLVTNTSTEKYRKGVVL